MIAAARAELAERPEPIEVFGARAEARAILWRVGELSLHDAVDELQAAAVRDGLVAQIGQDRVQAIMGDAFDAARHAEAPPEEKVPEAPDEPAAEPAPKRGAAASTLMTAQFLVAQGDIERLRDWLVRHSADERAAIHKHLRGRTCR